jgi:site-specific DNA-adenine methylase
LFGGGFNVGINAKADEIVYNDKESHVVELLKYFKNNDTDELLKEIDSLIRKYSLSKENANGFNQLRDYYNEVNNEPIVFYTLICYAFNYQIRFNQNGKYNMPFGKNRSSFNPVLRQKFVSFVEELHNRKCTFYNTSFEAFDFEKIGGV